MHTQEKRIQDKNIWVVYIATLVLGIGYGISIGLTSIFLDAKGFSKTQIGSFAAWFALGIISLSMPMGQLIRKVSAKPTLLCALLGYAVVVGIFPWMPGYTSIAVVRGLDGAFSVGIWVSCETILLARSDPRFKGFVMSIYAITMASGYVFGPLIAKGVIAFFPMWTAFLVASGFALAAIVIVLFFLDNVGAAGPEPKEQEAEPKGQAAISSLFWRIKTSCLATFSYGYFQASVVIFLPLYLMEVKGVSKEDTILITAIFATGMLLFSNVAGRVGDRFGHLRVMRVLGFIGMTMVLGFVWLDSFWAMCIAVFIAGATLASISPVSLALQGLIVSHADYSRANGLYNACYAAGMLLGPPISSWFFQAFGSKGGVYMLYHLTCLWAFFVLFTSVFHRDDPRAKAHAKTSVSHEG